MAFLRAFFLAFATLALIISGTAAYNGSVEGDLTRVGSMAESDYRPRGARPLLVTAANTQDPALADLLVLGDSFSKHLLWQGEVERLTGLKSLSYHFDEVGCLDNWLQQVLAAPSRPGRTVILETIERGFVDRLAALGGCAKVPMRPTLRAAHGHDGALGLVFDAGFNLRCLVNVLRSRISSGFQSEETVNVQLTRSDLFSSARADRLLYYVNDESKAQWKTAEIAHAIDNLEIIRRRLADHDMALLVLLIPDKSAVYRDVMTSPRFDSLDVEPLLLARGLSIVRLRTLLAQRKFELRDLYLPNDSHFSTTGYQLLAATLASSLTPR